ncbi:thylakoid membrane protein, chloroplastic [Raphidocelis subcapitata]|uniref:Thylakoid membrane protein, chloroplastic n=1 Tax=Raphidocelis subcapitata TaxID=307507 RepID=A0A2V0NKB6_9CHLO|nr:thylakoid membrane protein, chloroplastic [Raphidocelis subcapitata]|eukprot:GBF87736.1 thylakoid membrane protein, chloroplastic [Raphidocelis subcapitata]
MEPPAALAPPPAPSRRAAPRATRRAAAAAGPAAPSPPSPTASVDFAAGPAPMAGARSPSAAARRGGAPSAAAASADALPFPPPAAAAAPPPHRLGHGGREASTLSMEEQEEELVAVTATLPRAEARLESLAAWVGAAVAFGAGVWHWLGPDKAQEYFAGYLLEQSLSIDNLFVFVLVFKYFKTPPEHQAKVLNYGIITAAALRAVMVLLGTELVSNFEPVLALFAGVLLWSAYGLLTKGDDDDEEDLSDNNIVKICRKLLPFTDHYDGDRFWTDAPAAAAAATTAAAPLAAAGPNPIVAAATPVSAAVAAPRNPLGAALAAASSAATSAAAAAWRRRPGAPPAASAAAAPPSAAGAAVARRVATPLLLALAVVEISDVVFAVDSIPAVFGVTLDPFIVYTSNMMAILSLRSLYTFVSTVMQELKYLDKSVALVLAFVGAKMLLEFGDVEVPTGASLLVVAALLGGGVAASLLLPGGKEEGKE